mmetsp:Transcript_20184/g.56218  ORF Transcript_20184/g.56218 Transcript_20184/m.56218 type:complete len:83 (+) Transcript_20184:210-458(+)
MIVSHFLGTSSSIIARCDQTLASVFAHIIPLAAAAGTPMPGIVESPQTYKPGTGVLGPGQPPPPEAEMPGPYDPLCRFKKRS